MFAGCAGVGQAIELASSMEGMILIISADNLSRTIDSEEPSHFALRQFADGAVGIIVSHNAVSGHRIVATNGQTNASFHQYYRSVNGVVKRNLPPEVKPLLSAAYLDAWTSITRKLLVKSLDTEQLWIFCNQGDKKLFEPLIDALDFPDVQLVNTNHGHAGGADPWIGLMADTPPKGSQAILLSSGIGFHFHGILLEV
nr:hypothetical protein [Shewanella sp.]